MDRNTAVSTWRDVCGSDTVMAMGMVTGRMLEEFARRIEASERERCAKIVDVRPGTEAWEVIGGEEGLTMLRELAALIRGA